MATNQNDPAFPTALDEMKGCTKREYFAAMAMSKLVLDTGPEQAAGFAAQFADALIAELNKEQKP